LWTCTYLLPSLALLAKNKEQLSKLSAVLPQLVIWLDSGSRNTMTDSRRSFNESELPTYILTYTRNGNDPLTNRKEQHGLDLWGMITLRPGFLFLAS
jgi:hypothetical protein